METLLLDYYYFGALEKQHSVRPRQLELETTSLANGISAVRHLPSLLQDKPSKFVTVSIAFIIIQYSSISPKVIADSSVQLGGI